MSSPGIRKPPGRRGFSVEEWARGVEEGDRAFLGRAITLVESRRPDDWENAQELLARLLPRTGGAIRVGVTGVPGVGKSTFLESLGQHLIGRGHRVAVLAIDPSSSLSGGSILGDKTRMGTLSCDPAAFVRPSPSGGSLGGVTRKTRESILLCEAAGYDVVLVETVGVGQSETVVADMVDTVLLLLLPNAGDELQGIKRGILETVDLIGVNKCDGDHRAAARDARRHYLGALQFVRPRTPGWRPPVETLSGLEGKGTGELWEKVLEHRDFCTEHGELETARRRQLRRWMWSMVEDELVRSLHRHPGVRERGPELEQRVLAGELPPSKAASLLLSTYRDG